MNRESSISSWGWSGPGSREEVWEETRGPGGGPEEEAGRRSGRRYGYEVRLRGTVKRYGKEVRLRGEVKR